MFIAGLTGGAGCGKSTFREFFCRDSDADSLDCDQVVRELLATDATVKAAILAQVSPLAYDPAGGPNRSVLRELIFQDSAKRRQLEAILHPRVRERWQQAVTECRQQQRSLVIEIPLLFEKNLEAEFDCSILVAASPGTQLQRLAKRGLEVSLARQLLDTQLTNDEKISRATQVIWNDGTPDFLQAQSQRLASHLNSLYGN